MNVDDKAVAMKIVTVVGVLIALAVVFSLVARMIVSGDATKPQPVIGGSEGGSKVTSLEEMVSERLKPVGTVVTTATVAAPPAAVTTAVTTTSAETQAAGSTTGDAGMAVYKKACFACHDAAVAGAPKIGDNAAWAPRATIGMEALMASVLNGKGAMPPKGGAATLNEGEIESAIEYMLKEAGLASDDVTPTASVEVAPVEKTVTQSVTEAVSSTTEAVTDTATAVVASTTAAVSEKVVEVKEVVSETLEAAAEKVEAVTTQETAATTEADHSKGIEIYKSACFACHATGVAGAPKLGDKAAWAPRIATGSDTMYATAINGKGAMPPKGGRITLSDDEIKVTVDYMISRGQ